MCAGASANADRCSVAVGRSGLVPTSGAIAASETDVKETRGTRARESVTNGNLEVETVGAAGNDGNGRVAVWSRSIDGGTGSPESAWRCTAGGTTGET
jgi:hypothetical protein